MTIKPAGIFLVTRPGGHQDYDEYDSFIVAARDVFVARRTHPRATPDCEYAPRWCNSQECWVDCDNEPQMYHAWTTDIDELEITRVGDAAAGQLGVLCSSFNAG